MDDRRSVEAIELATVFDLGEKDLEIISLLQQDGRMLFTDIAEKVGLTEKTVRIRVQALLKCNAIRIVALTSPAALGYRAIALLGLTCAPGHLPSDVAKTLASLEGIDYVVLTSGRYPIIVEIVTTDRNSVLNILQNEIISQPGVASYELFEAAQLHYQKAGFLGVGYRSDPQGVQITPLSDVDWQIAAVLGKDGRASYRSISDAVGMSETQVRKRVASMLESQQMHILAIANPLAFPGRIVAWVAIKLGADSSFTSVIDKLQGFAEVTYILSTFGRFDLFVEVQTMGMNVLFDVIHRKFKDVSGVQSVEAFPYFKLHYKPLS